MMRGLVLLALIALGGAADMEKEGQCVLDGGEAASELLDASIYIWAAIVRCDKENPANAGDSVQCTIDISNSIESVNSMINIVLKALNKCGKLNTVNRGCGMAVSKLTENTAGLVSASAGIVEKCPNPLHPVGVASTPDHHNMAMCVVDLKASMKSFFNAIAAISKMKNVCENGGDDCTNNALRLVAAFAGLGEYLSGAYGHCSHKAKVAECGSAITELIHHLVKVAHTGNVIRVQCTVPVEQKTKAVVVPSGVTEVVPVEIQEPRLYEQKGKAPSAASDWSTLALVACLPISAIVSFVGGRVYATNRAQAREVMEEQELE